MENSRRNFIGSSVKAAATAWLANQAMGKLAFANPQTKSKESPSHSLQIQNQKLNKYLTQVYNTASDCTAKGELCHQHCQDQLASGETSFAHCNTAVQQMMVYSEALSKMASLKATRIQDLIDSGIQAAQECIDACKEHESHWKQGMHLECKECAHCCEKMIQACNELKKQLNSNKV